MQNLPFELKNVLLVPSLKTNLLSISALSDSGHSISFSKKRCSISISGIKTIFATRQGSLFYIPLNVFQSSAHLSKCLNAAQLWHLKFGHLHINALKRLMNSRMTKDLPNFNIDSFDCFTCLSAKTKRLPFSKSATHISSSLGDLIHSDICGPLPTPSYTGYKSFLTFTDDFSRYAWTYPLKTKTASEVLSKLQELDAFFLNHYGYHIKTLRTDNGSEFKNELFRSFCQENGILQQFTVPYSPQQNGVAERLNQTLLNSIRSMLTHSN
jgi:hypothetical protein